MRTLRLLPLLALALSSLALADASGQRPYNSKCASCHGKDGKGETEEGKKKHVKDLTLAKVQAELTDDAMAKVIADGKEEGEAKMKGFKDRLSDDEIKAVVAYVRTLKAQ